MRSLAICAVSSLAGLVTGNIVSPHLKKCLDIQLKEVEDAGVTSRESKSALESRLSQTGTKVNVQLFECHNEWNQRWHIENGQIKSEHLPDYCVTAEIVVAPSPLVYQKGANINWFVDDGSNVHLEKCFVPSNDDATNVENTLARQQWYLDERGNIILNHEQDDPRYPGVADRKLRFCLDGFAKESADGGREVYSEMQYHETVNAQIFRCHEDTGKHWRKNQIWTWQPRQKGTFVTEKFTPKDLGFKASSPVMMTAVAFAFLAVGVAIGVHRARRASVLTVPLEPTE